MAAAKQKSQIRLHWIGCNALLILAVTLSAVTVVQTTHRCRLSYAQLQTLQSARWDMQENWSRLLLQESALATHHRVEQAARQRLQMHAPGASETQLVMQ